MATWTPKEKIVDITSVLLERKSKLGPDENVYSSKFVEHSNSESENEENEKVQLSSHGNTLTKTENIFSHEITDVEKNLIELRVSEHRKKVQEYERREYEKKASHIKRVFDFLVDEEIKFALKENNDQVSEVITRFTDDEYLRHVRKSLAREEPSNFISQMTREQQEKHDMIRKRVAQIKAPKTNKEKGHSVPRLTLDIALKQMEKDPKAAMAGWSQARITAYQAIHTRPNSYYYRFNAPGEEQRTGAWTNEEKKIFLQRVKEHGADKDWGIFSMTIPGRVGYQCSSFYRLLIQRGEISDPRYYIDDKGKAQFIFAGKQEGASGEPREKRALKSSGKLRPRKKTKRRSSGDSGESSDEEFTAPQADWRTTSRTRRQTAAEDSNMKDSTPSDEEEFDEAMLNPLPGYIDPITLDEVVQPAISPYGHVMGYANWVRCLNSEGSRNICPLTKQPLTKRDLVILTHENVDLYKDKIIK